METIGGDGSKTRLVMKKGKHKSTTGIGASLTTDYREKEESNNNLRREIRSDLTKLREVRRYIEAPESRPATTTKRLL